MMQIHNFDQYSDEWWAVRDKKMTASHAQSVGNCGAGLKTYITEIMMKHYSKGEEEQFSNRHTQRGHDLEDQAGMAYSFSFDPQMMVEKIGFVELTPYVGCSPDLLAGDNGLVEIKAFDDKGHFRLILGGNFESKYIWQCQFQMLCCGKRWCDLISYNPNFDEYLIVKRVYPDDKKVEALRKGFVIGEKLIKDIELKMEGKKEND